ncbi:VOC family protein [Rhizorhabdus histidinilytica]|jgi:hypothetical protein|uniref:Methylmalonyl-CoA epimerase n=1 Tax=Rhizorhabdus histidinilytica TaxID=439228 RepID=A0A1T5FT37_9SPHN|nr:VOC family protein [Rhizorhabdus histidinilytica]SKB99335.1 methylmalonyl-CoA epimerase [Rhizorhabdus histidinilytica]
MRISYSRPDRQRIVQNAYVVRDLDEAMVRWNRTLGIGPFLVRRHIALRDVLYRGRPASLDISAAHAQAGDIQIELVMQHCDQPSAFRDMFDGTGEGLHHVAIFPEDHDAMVAHYRQQGFAAATDIVTAEGRGATYIDTRPMLGHMMEIYRVNDSLVAFYEEIAAAAEGWDGRNLRIELGAGS